MPTDDELDDKEMADAYLRMARDAEHESETEEWWEALIGDAADAS